MNFMDNCGSILIPILCCMIIYNVALRIINRIAIKNFEQEKWRKIGSKFYS